MQEINSYLQLQVHMHDLTSAYAYYVCMKMAKQKSSQKNEIHYTFLHSTHTTTRMLCNTFTTINA